MITSGPARKKTESFIYYEYTVYFMLQLYFFGREEEKTPRQTTFNHGGTVQLELGL